MQVIQSICVQMEGVKVSNQIKKYSSEVQIPETSAEVQ